MSYRVRTMKTVMTKASQTSSLLVSDLKYCHEKASPLEEIVVRQLLQQAVELERRIQEFVNVVALELVDPNGQKS